MDRAAARILAAILVSALLAACGHSASHTTTSSTTSGIASLPPSAIIQASRRALANARTVHVHGSFNEGGVPTAIDMQLVNGRGGRGTIAQNGLSVRVVVTGSEVYLQGGQAFWRHYAGALAAQLLQGHWLKTPAGGRLSPLSRLANLQQLYASIIASPGTLKTGTSTTVDGQRVVPVTDTSHGGTLYVAATGPPYPVQVTGSGSRRGSLVFDDYNQPVTLAAPAGAIGLPQL